MINTQQFKLEGLTLQQLRYFNSVAEGDTFADAAATIGISQSALSQGIARLEQVMGARLLERDGRRRRLTNAGELVAGYARRVLGETEILVDELDDRLSGAAGTLRVGMIDAAALYLFRDQIAQFRESYPAISLSMTVAASSDLEQRLADFRDDIAILVGPSYRLETELIIREPLHLYGSGDDTATGTWALYPAGSRTREAIDVGLAAVGIRPRVIAESGNPAVLRELAALTGSFTVLPEAIGAAGTPLPQVLPAVATREFVTSARSMATLSPQARAFIAALHV
jgi:LysR family cyn operon transcriptional activator